MRQPDAAATVDAGKPEAMKHVGAGDDGKRAQVYILQPGMARVLLGRAYPTPAPSRPLDSDARGSGNCFVASFVDAKGFRRTANGRE